MKMKIEFSFTAEVETNGTNQSEVKAKARELLLGKLPPNIHNRKVEIAGRHDKISIKVKRNVLTLKVLDVTGSSVELKRNR